MSLNSQYIYPSVISHTLIDLNPDKYNQGLHYYPFMVNLDRCNGCFNTLDDSSNKICVLSKTEDESVLLIL